MMNTDEGRLEVLQIDDETNENCLTFILKDEDHTLGNVLKYIIMQNPQVEFCAYSIPNPSENLICLRIQTNSGITPAEAFKQGLKDLQEVCDHITDTYKGARMQYDQRQEELHTDR